MKLEAYMSYLLSSPSTINCVQASQVLQVSHDQVNRFLLKGNYTGKDLYEKAKTHLLLQAGTLTIDDTVLDKPYSEHNSELITFLYSGTGQPHQNKNQYVFERISKFCLEAFSQPTDN